VSAALWALGAGDAFSAGGRGHSCYLLEDSAGLALIDAGASALPGLLRAGQDPGRVGAVHFTHLHGDHIAGWPFLLLHARYRGPRTAPLWVTGPPGTGARLSALWALCYPDTAQKELPFAVHVRELQPGEQAELCGRSVRAFAAQHQKAPHVALSLRVDGPAGRLAFTGDTGPHQGLVALAQGADALVAECSDLAAPALEAAARKHLAWDDLRALLPRLGVRRALLGHLGEEARAARARIEAEGAALGVEVRVCDDGDRIAL
jgi:ribonuclease BN (tRNA processing enzyme)